MAEPSRSKPRKAPGKKRAGKATPVATPVAELLDLPATGADRMSALPERAAPLPPAAVAAKPGTAEHLDADRLARAAAAQLSGGLDTSVFTNAWADYWAKLLNSPARQAALAQQVVELANDTLAFAQRAAAQAAQAMQSADTQAAIPPLSPHEGAAVADQRYADPAWTQYPFNLLARAHQNFTAFAREATRDVAGLDAKHRELVDFSLRLMGDATSPANNLATNPQLLAQTIAENGANLQRGWQHLLEDMDRQQKGLPAAGTEQFVVGEHVACTPGQVVYRNALIELIQYSPTTPKVHRAPVLIVPAWIMKYYVLDLSAKNSLVRWLVAQGHTVFCVSWKNPTPEDRDLGMDDYVKLGLEGALDAVTSIVPGTPVQAVGYCIGGTLLAIGAAALAARGDQRIGSLSLFAAQTDFSEPGELSLFISPGQLAMLDAQMYRQGVLESSQMGGAFQLLRPQDLIFQPAVNAYLKGQRDGMVDLMAWNADGTRMPWKMHSEYLHRLYLHNELANHRFPVAGKTVTLNDVRAPAFVVGTETDHVAPWKSVYKADRLLGSDSITFLLTSGGHNAGIVSGPVHPKRHHRVRERKAGEPQLTPGEWMATTEKQPGSWWPVWERWLAAHGGPMVKPPKMGSAAYPVVCPAPGTYVLQR